MFTIIPNSLFDLKTSLFWCKIHDVNLCMVRPDVSKNTMQKTVVLEGNTSIKCVLQAKLVVLNTM